ncbi:hypothetical protein CPSG_04059 [Coccidioides posadasii str. Silveira]|uniref:Uncharacterized protein n=1 Tax=Coccidioides posadasii (strain RMSCC 757 / Silveira) TaxID=443226 RepID=E9D1K1_COCPS|nr:hypothetical protein CPSG_04059 [Coccidioides posadasii str. Silveira]
MQQVTADVCRHFGPYMMRGPAGGERCSARTRIGMVLYFLLACWIFSEAHSSGDVTPKRRPIGQLLLAESAWKFELVFLL